MLSVRVARFEPRATPEMVEFASFAFAIDPASMVLVTVPVSPDVMTVPVVAGMVKTVPVPAVAAGINWTEPEVEPGKVTLVMPVNAWLADARFNATEVVPTNSDELPSTPDGIVPLRFPAVRLVKLAPDTAPNDADQVPEVIVPTVAKLDNDVNDVLLEAVMLAAVPVVFWFSVGTSAATMARNDGTPAMPLGAARKKFAVFDAYGLSVSP